MFVLDWQATSHLTLVLSDNLLYFNVLHLHKLSLILLGLEHAKVDIEIEFGISLSVHPDEFLRYFRVDVHSDEVRAQITKLILDEL